MLVSSLMITPFLILKKFQFWGTHKNNLLSYGCNRATGNYVYKLSKRWVLSLFVGLIGFVCVNGFFKTSMHLASILPARSDIKESPKRAQAYIFKTTHTHHNQVLTRYVQYVGTCFWDRSRITFDRGISHSLGIRNQKKPVHEVRLAEAVMFCMDGPSLLQTHGENGDGNSLKSISSNYLE